MNDIIIVLKGIVLLLSSLFVLGIADSSWTELLAFVLFLAGILTCLAGFHNYNVSKKD